LQPLELGEYFEDSGQGASKVLRDGRTSKASKCQRPGKGKLRKSKVEFERH
jgi:hypothetical protein